MRLRAALGLVVLACAGCGGTTHTVEKTVSVEHANADLKTGFRVGVVGPLAVTTPGVLVRRGGLAEVADEPLVLVSAKAAGLSTVADAARAHPDSHFAFVGASTKDDRVGNLVGLVLRDDQAAELGGVVAGLVVSDAGAAAPRVAWVGPEEGKLAAAFGRGVHRIEPAAAVLHQWSRSIPARCKEATLTVIGRGAGVVMAHGGLCAEAAVDAAHEQNVPALRLADFELPSVAADLLARDAVAGVFHGHEDIVFGAGSGAIGVRALDPRISLATVVRARSAAETLGSPSGAAG